MGTIALVAEFSHPFQITQRSILSAQPGYDLLQFLHKVRCSQIRIMRPLG